MRRDLQTNFARGIHAEFSGDETLNARLDSCFGDDELVAKTIRADGADNDGLILESGDEILHVA
ncbi:hypothetical protein H2198_010563 [Neophaeococcomyces mojaviensis]|uniref:Uncharacterized protein n=1 Tax=Neophaeococcomyces mojaviensis TaxID=3383035 RepID=A0ACC2ZRB1_9EURO|nr:hypothetical protein H2198_010563 [Knufia sp. JES_112]